MNASAIRVVEHFAGLAPGYDVLLCDVWGVVHDGLTAHVPACDALARFRAAGGAVILITNAPRPSSAVVRMLDRLTVSNDAYDGIISSGDVTRHEVEARTNQTIMHIGPERDRPLFDGLPVTFAPVDTAGYCVCTGLFDDDTETPDDYRDMLGQMRRRGLFMVCANPDVVVSRGATLVYCAGALADLYRDMGGEVLYAGKPHAPIYTEALQMAQRIRGRPVARERVLAIGDSVRTDLTGAHAFGVDFLFVAAGIHAEELGGALEGEALARLFALADRPPAAVMRQLAW